MIAAIYARKSVRSRGNLQGCRYGLAGSGDRGDGDLCPPRAQCVASPARREAQVPSDYGIRVVAQT
jgi:hypothetical protein